VSPAVRRLVLALAAAALAVGPAAAPALAGAGLAGAAAAVPPSHAPSVSITTASAAAGHIDLLVTGSNLPAGTALTAAAVRVTVAGRPVTAHATGAGRTTTGTGGAPDRAVLIVLDTSGSMAGARLDAARTVTQEYATALPADIRVGLVTAAAPSTLRLRPDTDRAKLARTLAGLSAGGRTALFDAVRTAVATLPAAGRDGSPATRRLVVLTDGADTASSVSLAGAIAAVRAGRVGLDVVGLNLAATDRAPLAALAAAGGGSVLDAADAAGLSAAFQAAARSFSATLPLRVTIPRGLTGTVRVQVAVAVDGRDLTSAVDLPLGVVPAAKPAATPSPAPAAPATSVPAQPLPGLDWRLWLLLGAVFAGLLGLGGLAVSAFGGGGRKRVRQLDRYRLVGPPAAAEPRSQLVRAALAGAAALARRRGMTERIAAELDRAGVAMRVQEWLVLRVCVGVVGAAVVGLLTRLPLAGLLAGVLLGWLGGRMYLSVRSARRTAAFAEQLPEMLRLLASSMRSGFSLQQALEGIAREGSQPAAGEFARALGESRLGAPLEAALAATADRMRSRDLAWVVLAIRIQRRTGGNLAEVLLNTVQTMRERARIRRHVRALSAEGRMSAWILVGLPVVVGGWLFLVRRDYLRPLYTEPLGIGMLVAAVLLLAVGGLWTSRLIKVEV
jgi:Flp pilus assembly protein TadB/Mg-chelatase subunit ChlD